MKLLRLKMPPVIMVIGVGGGGINAVNHLYQQDITGVDFFIFDTDAGALELSPVPNKVKLGTNLTGGISAWSVPKGYETASIENMEDIKTMLEFFTKILFIITGPGGNTGTEASAIIAKAARELDILTIGIVTTPFLFKGKHRLLQSDQGFAAFKEQADAYMVISNRQVRRVVSEEDSSDKMAEAYDILTSAVRGIAGMVNPDGYSNVGIKDVRKAVKDSGQFIVGNGSAEGMNRAAIAADAAFSIPYYNENKIEDAKSILLHMSMGNRELTIDEHMIIMSELRMELKRDTDIVWNTSGDKTLGEKISVTIIATRFQTRNARNNPHLFSAERKTTDHDSSDMKHSAPGIPEQDNAENSESLFDKRNPETMLKTCAFL